MKDTKQQDLRKTISPWLQPDADGEWHAAPPEGMAGYMEIAKDLFDETEARRCLTRPLLEGELFCLIGITKGYARASLAKMDEPKE